SVLEALPPLTGRYGLPPTALRQAFDAAALEASSGMSSSSNPANPNMRGSRPSGALARPGSRAPSGPSASSSASASNGFSRASAGGTPSGATPRPLFDAPSVGPQPLFGEASGTVR